MADKQEPVSATEEWETVDRGSRIGITFETFGDAFIGVFEDTEEVTNPNNGETWTAYLFDGRAVHDGKTGQPSYEVAGEPCSIAAGWDLSRALDKLTKGQIARITYKRNMDTGQASDMKVFTVDIKR